MSPGAGPHSFQRFRAFLQRMNWDHRTFPGEKSAFLCSISFAFCLMTVPVGAQQFLPLETACQVSGDNGFLSGLPGGVPQSTRCWATIYTDPQGGTYIATLECVQAIEVARNSDGSTVMSQQTVARSANLPTVRNPDGSYFLTINDAYSRVAFTPCTSF